eukprot:scaffold289_cov144-Skeletonema_menzelii.AAC.10
MKKAMTSCGSCSWKCVLQRRIVVVGLVSVDRLSFSLLTLMLRVKVLDGSWRRCDYTIVSQKRQKKTKDVNC